MPYNPPLLALLEHIALTDAPVIIDWYSSQQWPVGALKRFMEAGLLVKATRAESMECRGCDKACYMDVLLSPGVKPRAFIVCDDPDMQAEMGRIQIPLEQLQQSKSGTKQLAKVLSKLLELDCRTDNKLQPDKIQLGMLSNKRGRRWVTLHHHPLSLEVNQRFAPVEEILYFVGDELVLDRSRINVMLHAVELPQGKSYTPSTSKRDEGKRKTLAMHQDWNDEYLRLKRQHPKKNDVWISDQIAKMPIAQGRQATRIYRVMK